MIHLPEALRLAALGWQVFALGPTGFPFPNCRGCAETCSTPSDYDACDHLVCHGCYAGTTDVDRLTAMWEHLPHALVGIRTGRPSGIFVLDFDMHTTDKDGNNALQRLMRDGSLFKSVAAKTGGGGMHLYYRHPGELSVPNDNRGKLAPGVDVKGEGGYVIAPPSAKRGKPSYSWIPGLDPWSQKIASLSMEALLTITKSDDRPISLNPHKVTVCDDAQILWKWEDALEDLRDATSGERNELLYRAACRGGEVVASGQLASATLISLLEVAAAEAGLKSSEIRQTIRSGLNRGAHDFLKDNA